MFTQPEPTLEPKQERQRARNQQQIVEVTAEKVRMNVRLHQPAIQRIKNTGRQKKRIAPVGESFHNKAMIAVPASRAIASLSRANLIVSIGWVGF